MERIPSPLPHDSEERKQYPLYRGLMRYFPAALAAVAHHSYKGNEKHNAGLPMQHARNKSTDHEDCILRHLMEGDYEGVAWRALALLQEKLEAEGAPVAPAATFGYGASLLQECAPDLTSLQNTPDCRRPPFLGIA